MTGRGRWIAGAALAACAALSLGTWRFLPGEESDVAREAPDGDALAELAPGDGAIEPSPFDAVDEPSEPPAPTPDGAVAPDARAPAEAPRAVEPEPVDVASLGRTPIGDDDFERLAERLSDDPALLQALIDEVRSETDPERLDRLLRLLGDVDDPAVAALASELVYSGDPALSPLGLDLLKRVRPGDPDVHAVVSGLLSTETEARVLVPTLTALARPGNTARAERASLANQVALLTDHPDPAVRRTSVNILSRWSDDATHTPRLVAGLTDEDPTVRRAAAFAFVGHPDQSDGVRRELFSVAEDADNDEGTRRGALLALRRMDLGDEERARVVDIGHRLDVRPATR